jgi:class 3 adenylate cyclase
MRYDGDLMGDGVNIAARLQTLAKPARLDVARLAMLG